MGTSSSKTYSVSLILHIYYMGINIELLNNRQEQACILLDIDTLALYCLHYETIPIEF